MVRVVFDASAAEGGGECAEPAHEGAIDAGQIRLEDEAAPPKLRRHLPRWA